MSEIQREACDRGFCSEGGEDGTRESESYTTEKRNGARLCELHASSWVSNTKHTQRFGEDGRYDPQRTTDMWDGFMSLVGSGKIQPVIYKGEYQGLEAVSQALEDAKNHKAWGRAILRIDENAEKELSQERSRL